MVFSLNLEFNQERLNWNSNKYVIAKLFLVFKNFYENNLDKGA